MDHSLSVIKDQTFKRVYMRRLLKLAIVVICALLSTVVCSQSETEGKFSIIKTYNTLNARQGVAVDENYFYTINNTFIEKYNKNTGQFVGKWTDEHNKLKHFDSGAVIENKLYCAHSNYPDIPMMSSIEVFDAQTLKHINSVSFGIKYGSCTWIDFYKNYFWVCFAHYDKYKDILHKDNSWTVLVKFDSNFNEMESWCFPDTLLSRFRPMSCSGGSWGSDGYLYVTGHDHPEIYKLQLPDMGSVLELIEIIEIGSEGQGIAWDRFADNTLYSINRKNNQVLKSVLKRQNQMDKNPGLK